MRGVVEEVLESHGIGPGDTPILHSDELEEADEGALVIHPGRPSMNLRDEAREAGAMLWGEDQIVREVGKAALVQLGAEFELNLGGDGVPGSPIEVRSEEALDMASGFVDRGAAAAMLEMVPHRVFEYRCRCVVREGDLDERFDSEGRAALDMVEGELSELEFDEVVNLTEEEMGQILDPFMDEGGARESARRLLREEMARDVKLEREKRDTQIYETRTVKPPSDGVELDEGRTVYRGIWTVRGSGTDVVIDSYTGEILSPDTGGGVELV